MKTANILHATIARDADCEKGTKGPWESRAVVLLVSGATIALPTPQPELLWDLVQRRTALL